MNADDIHSLVGAYALDALDEHERAEFETHLARCLTCQTDVAEFRNVASDLARSVAIEPPPQIRSRVMADIADVRQASPIQRPAVARPRRQWITALAGAAAAAIIAVLAAQLVSVRDERDRSESVAEVLAAPDAVIVALDGDVGSGRLVSSPATGRAVLIIDGLPALPDDRAYQLWYVNDNQQISAGVYTPRNHRIIGSTDHVPEDTEIIGITEEPAGGSTTPTGSMILSGETAATT